MPKNGCTNIRWQIAQQPTFVQWHQIFFSFQQATELASCHPSGV